jgi:hypothetical protein
MMTFGAPEAEQTVSISRGWTMGAAVATPSDIRNHAKTHQRDRIKAG